MVYLTETLVEIIKDIENLSPDVEVNKAELIKNTWEKWGAKNKLVRDRSEGKTTFLDEYENTIGGYDGIEMFLPYKLPEGFEEKISDLCACAGNAHLYESIGTYANGPIGLGGLIGSIFALLAAGSDKKIKKVKMDRRQFLKSATAPFIFGSIIGGMTGSFLSIDNKKTLKGIKENAIYLDNIYNKYIR